MTIGLSAALSDVRTRHPEWHAWLALYGEARAACEDDAWTDAVASVPPAALAPFIGGVVFPVDAGRARTLVRTLLERAFAFDARAVDDAAAGQVLEAAINDDRDALGTLAKGFGLAADLFAEVAGLATMPLLQACRAAWASRIPEDWVAVACPVCDAWAALAEARGLERTLRFRCARCGADWRALPVRCALCGNTEHETLGALVSERSGDLRRVETCGVCLGYVKTVTTLQPCAPEDVRLLDLDTVELDVAALEHGYARAARPARPRGVRVVPRRRRRFGRLLTRAR